MIINSGKYKQGKRVGDVSLDDISEVIVAPDTFLWLGLHDPDLPLMQKLQDELGLHDLAIEDALKAHQLSKIEVYGDHLFIVLKTAILENGVTSYGETHLFVGPKFVVSIRHGASTSYKHVREFCESNPKMLHMGTGFVLYSIIDFVVDHYRPIVEQIESEFERIEVDMFSEQINRSVIERLYDLKRQTITLRNAALPLDDICNQLMRFHSDIIRKDLQVYFRDIQDHTNRIIGMTDNLREFMTAAMQVNLGFVAVKQNDVVKKLAGWGAILAIPTVIFSLYGMNFRVMPELNWAYGYPLVLVVTVVSCVLLYRKLKADGWF